MAQGLLGGVLPAIYSGADQLKRGVYGLLTNPQEQAQRAVQSLLQSRAERQALMGQAFANPDRPFQVTNPQALSQLGTDVLTGELGIAPVGMIAYHGTPHNIVGKFDINKVGTGEGAQSYGHGMYFAEARPVAEQYQAALSDTKYLSGGKELKGNDAWAASFLHDFQGNALPKKVDVNTAVAKANEILKSGEVREEIVSKIKQLDKAGVAVESGNLYKVDIPDEYIPKMLDWDKPLNLQSPDVLKSIKIPQEAVDRYNEIGKRLDELQWTRGGLDSPEWNKLGQEASELRAKYGLNRSGEELYQEAFRVAKQMGAENPSQVAAESLKNQGIQGVRYLDQFSRQGGGTSNFVVFDPTDVKILERNDKPLEGLLD